MLLQVKHKAQTSPDPLVNKAVLASLHEHAIAEFAAKIPEFIKSDQTALSNNNGYDVHVTTKLIVINPDKLEEVLKRTSLEEHERIRLMADIYRS